MKLEDLLASERRAVEEALQAVLPPEEQWPQRLHRAMRYAVFAGGKRIRPILVRMACRAAGGDGDAVSEAAAAVELIHTYSLVHDDLPALDDDVLRRGRETVHVAFDEATAILVGDALLTEGFRLLASSPPGCEYAPRRAQATVVVAEAVGSRGMVGGQVEDLGATASTRSLAGSPAELLERIHTRKTGALLGACVELGAVLAGAGCSRREEYRTWGQRLGLAFQVADDILDETASADELGKSPGKDVAAGKLTYVTLYGLDEARRRLGWLERELSAGAVEMEGPDGVLGELARFVTRRRN